MEHSRSGNGESEERAQTMRRIRIIRPQGRRRHARTPGPDLRSPSGRRLPY
ncbi:hypothetical protein Sros_7114 [Streptosporangium roseum DSM 43021]|uniref:Uncharacterized protein n=1 Tax=Streptosporangium roseum (strain ATCC 12428 / DSM 43021 / JCM 3005 / KCTC 9067 / NCIMB 10171 / NRRL 2505 / NI 9100) TaxID=479432 RepID=D2BAH9_STRRD|nr:hypothetical protein Sros_7114 [Streptosporangium roseum DSM 43021]